jgi:hypothetical protein
MVLVMATAMLPACLLFTSLDETSGGGEFPGDGGTSDVVVPAADAADSSVGADAPIDAVPRTDAGFCLQDAGPGQVFCTEFPGPTVAEGWSSLASGVGSLELDQGNLLAKVPVLPAYDEGKYVARIIDGVFSSLACSFAFRRDVLGEELVSIAELIVEMNAAEYNLQLYTGVTTGRLLVARYPGDGGDGDNLQAVANVAPPIGEWHRYTIEATKTHVRAYVDGQLEASIEHGTPLAQLRSTFKLGIPRIDGDNLQPWQMRFDDVRCTLSP